MSAISLSILFVCATKCRKSGAFSSHFDAEKHNRKTTKLPTDVYLSSTPGGVLKLVSSESFPLMGSCRKEIVSHFSQPVFLPYFLLHPRDLFEFPNTLQRDSLKSGFSKNFFFSPLQIHNLFHSHPERPIWNFLTPFMVIPLKYEQWWWIKSTFSAISRRTTIFTPKSGNS